MNQNSYFASGLPITQPNKVFKLLEKIANDSFNGNGSVDFRIKFRGALVAMKWVHKKNEH